MSKHSQNNNGVRLPVIDALRGLALAGIVWVTAAYFAAPWGLVKTGGAVDAFADWATLTLATGKFFPLFSFLFGLGLGVAAAGEPGADRRVRRRLGALVVGGGLHAVLLFNGDILLLYGVIGWLVWRMRGATNRTLMRRAAWAGALGVVLQALIMVPWELPAVPKAVAGVGYLGSYADSIGARVGALPYVAIVLASFNGGMALAAILLGLVVGRRGLPVTATGGLSEPKRWRLLMVGGLVLSAAGAAGLRAEGAGVALALSSAFVWSLATPLVALGWFCGLWRVLASRLECWPVRALTRLGSMSLSAYLAHSLLLGLLFHGWGLGLHGVLGWAEVVLSAWGVFGLLLIGTAVWRSSISAGPAEMLMKAWVNHGQVTRASGGAHGP